MFFITIIAFSIFSFDTARAVDKKPKKPKIKMKTVYISLLSLSVKLNELKPDEKFYEVAEPLVAFRWLPIISAVREGSLTRQQAVDSINVFSNELWDYMEMNIKAKKIIKYSDKEWVFPVKGYGPAAIGGNNGSGYITAGFDFFDKNSGGHPAHDIFINDGNQDCLDDATNKPVEILSMSGGIVIETRKNWTTDMMDIKGGNIVYVYDNFSNGFFYYAHLNEVYVNVGEMVKPGTVLGTMGRTGKNAFPSRSPTHLHIMYVRSVNGDMIPDNIYNDLLNAKLTP